MAYDLHLERIGDTPIAFGEWQAAIEACEGVRLMEATAHTITNPKTGEVISIGAPAGGAEVFFPDSGQWLPVFRWRSGSAAFASRFEPGDTSHPAWRAAVALANRLGAAIRGDEGENYDLQTGRTAA